ncbi:MAG: hypothetical protein Q9168_001134 [Polycauliona sp. 1 TL-2023]
MQLLKQNDLEPVNPAATSTSSQPWMFLSSTSPLQVRKRLSRAYNLIPSSPTRTPPHNRKTCRTYPHEAQREWTKSSSPDLEPSPATTPPPSYLSLLRPKPEPQPQEEPDTTTLNPKYAQQALFLLQSSLHEYAENPTFARQLYIHAAVYLLQGLPPASSLSQPERLSLSSAVPKYLLPPEIGSDDNNNASHNAAARSSGETDENRATKKTPQHNDQPSLLHRAFSTFVTLAIIVIGFLTPYFQHLMTSLRYYDREYCIHERACQFLAATARRIWDSVVAAVDVQSLIWFAAEVSSGVAEGWKRGMGG